MPMELCVAGDNLRTGRTILSDSTTMNARQRVQTANAAKGPINGSFVVSAS
jgi:hypothetical protein